MKGKRKCILFMVFISLLVAGLGYILFLLVPEPPLQELAGAQTGLSGARKNRADIFSARLYNEAKAYYDSAIVSWHNENNRFIYFRDYRKAGLFAERAGKNALKASEDSKTVSTDLQININLQIVKLNDVLKDLDRFFTAFPLEPEVRDRISRGKFLLRESEISCSEGHYLQADSLAMEAGYLLTTSYKGAYDTLKAYFRLYPEWKKWVEKTLDESRAKHTYSVIVDKVSRKIYVYFDGIRKYEYTAELGVNWVGDKKVKGDKATPEGIYKVAGKFEKSRTRYYKALLLDYPNNEDNARFRNEVAAGHLPKNAKIGDLIEIHGNGGRGVDWTDGCIAVKDKDMDVIYNIVGIGTPVIIVGSVADLDHVLKR